MNIVQTMMTGGEHRRVDTFCEDRGIRRGYIKCTLYVAKFGSEHVAS